MRTKQEITYQLDKNKDKTPSWESTASLHERIQIEILIDIRDILNHSLATALTIQRPMYDDD